jgi:hypothetical protein
MKEGSIPAGSGKYNLDPAVATDGASAGRRDVLRY